jgi:nucleotide-binding universal stress UspA family protein
MISPKISTPMKIILAVDGSEHSFTAAQFICDLPLPEGSVVVALGVLSQRHTPSRYLLAAALDKAQTILQDGGAEVQAGLLHGNPAEALTSFAHEHKADLLVVGAKGLRATLGILLGGVAQQVVEYANCPVLVVRAPYEKLLRVLLVVDGSSHSQCAVGYLTRFPFPERSNVHVMHVLPPIPQPEVPLSTGRHPTFYQDIPTVSSYETEQEIARQAEYEGQAGQVLLTETIEVLRASGIEATGVLKRGDAANEIIEYVKSQNIHLITAGSRGLSEVKGWLLGSVSRKLVHYAGCSVLIIK